MKRKMRRMVSMMAAVMTFFSAVLSPLASDLEELEQPKLPDYEEVKELLDEDEVVTAEDLELAVGCSFDAKTDFTKIKIPVPEKVEVTFHEAKDETGVEFTTERTGVYKAVYFVKPLLTEHPAYQISRNLIITETVGSLEEESEENCVETEITPAEYAEMISEGMQEEQESVSNSESESEQETENSMQVPESDSGEIDAPESESTVTETGDSETEAPVTETIVSETETTVEETEIQEPESDETESESDLEKILEDAAAQGINFAGLAPGESLTFYTSALGGSGKNGIRLMAVTKVKVVCDSTPYSYADYGYGTYQTHKYTVTFNGITATAYCIQPSKGAPGSSDGYTVKKLKDAKMLAKVCYYGTKASQDNGFFAERHPDFSAGQKFIITHIAAAYAYGSSDAFSGCNDKAKKLALELYEYCASQPDIPDVDMAFSEPDAYTYVDGNSQRTNNITFAADALQTVKMTLPAGVQLHNISSGVTSAAGASVEISGGTTFYLSAPLTQATDTGAVWASTMKGSITKDYSAYVIQTGSSTQNLALVFGEGVDDEKYVSFSVHWLQKAAVKVVKADSESGAPVPGAVFGIFADQGCTQLIAQMPATGADGTSRLEIYKTQDVVYLEEITAPARYKYNTTAYNVTLVADQESSVSVPNEEQLGSLTIYKEGEDLTGASKSENGVTFEYTVRRQKGAVYSVHAGADIIAADGRLIYHQGDLVAENLTTGADGSVKLEKLHFGSYTVTEVKAPAGFVCTGETKTVLVNGDAHVDVALDVTFRNERQKAKVTATKIDRETKNPLVGGIYGLYAGNDIKNVDGAVIVTKDTLIDKVVTTVDGTAVYQADLPLGNSYYLKEIQAPDNYVYNGDSVFPFTFEYSNDKEAVQEFSYTFDNERVKAVIRLVKSDAETGVPQGDAKLENAIYGLFARKDIVHPDGRTGVLYPAGSQVATFTTDAEGKAEVWDLYLGSYFVKELTPSIGYLLDEKEYDIECSFEGDRVPVVERECLSGEIVIKQPFQVIKVADNDKTDADLLEGVGFSAYLVSSLAVNEDGTYDFSSAKPVVIRADGGTEMFTDKKGHAVSIALPYGTYIVRETTPIHNFLPVQDFYVKITENNPTEPQVWRVLLDDQFEAKIRIIKKDDETGKSVLLPGTEFRIYDIDNEKYIEQVTTYPETKVHKTFFTNANGSLVLPQNLKLGHYRVEEVTAPEGYSIGKNYVEIHVDQNTAYKQDEVSGDSVIEAEYYNHPTKGKILIHKEGETLDSFGDDFKYKVNGLAGAVFEVYTAEDIYTSDFQTDADGNRILMYGKDMLIAEVTTDETGTAVAEDLPLGKYRIVEKTAPAGFVWNAETQEVELVYEGQDVPVVEEEITFVNERQKVRIIVEKQDATNGATVEGAVFGLYNAEDILSGEDCIVEADTLLQEVTSDDNGQAEFTLDLPLGKYYVQELSAPDGYISSDEVLEFDASYQGQDVSVIELEAVKKNEPTTVRITKSDITTGEELDGALLVVMDKDGNEIDSWTSIKGKPHDIQGLTVGETYTLRETLAPYGYLKAEEVQFTVEDTAEVQPVEMEDDVPTATLIISKKGEFLDKVTVFDEMMGGIRSLFGYLAGDLQEVSFDVYAAEDIKAADGVSEDYYKADDLVATIVTDASGVAKLSDLPLGKYYVEEVETAHGYVLDDEARYIDLTYRDQDTAVVVYDEKWQNARQKVSVSILKLEKDSEVPLQGGLFGLFAGEDVLSNNKEVLITKDTLIESGTTDANGRYTFTADLPVDGTYYTKELRAPDGYVTNGEVQTFTFEYEGEDTDTAVYEFIFEDEPTDVEVSKQDLTTGKELKGALLRVIDENGNLKDEWISKKKPHKIKGLAVGETYDLIETKPADGYTTAESVSFTVGDTTEKQTIVMQDDITKVKISKTDITGSKEIPGAKLTILDRDGNEMESWTSGKKPHYIEKLPVGTYTIREEQAPKGYVIAEEVPFEVLDTGEIQMVEMKDDTAKGKVTIDKKDQETGDAMAGVEFELRDEKGKVLETLVTDASGRAESSLYEIATYKKGAYDEPIRYILVETKTLEGYVLDSTEHEIIFDYVDDRTPVIEVHKELTNQKGAPDTSPKTGDDTNLWPWFALMGGAILVFLFIAIRKLLKEEK